MRVVVVWNISTRYGIVLLDLREVREARCGLLLLRVYRDCADVGHAPPSCCGTRGDPWACVGWRGGWAAGRHRKVPKRRRQRMRQNQNDNQFGNFIDVVVVVVVIVTSGKTDTYVFIFMVFCCWCFWGCGFLSGEKWRGRFFVVCVCFFFLVLKVWESRFWFERVRETKRERERNLRASPAWRESGNV